jgi:hypothetical protein
MCASLSKGRGNDTVNKVAKWEAEKCPRLYLFPRLSARYLISFEAGSPLSFLKNSVSLVRYNFNDLRIIRCFPGYRNLFWGGWCAVGAVRSCGCPAWRQTLAKCLLAPISGLQRSRGPVPDLLCLEILLSNLF